MTITVHPAARLRGTLRMPPDKSLSHRAVILASFAEGRSRVDNYLPGDDTDRTIRCLQQLGVRIERDGSAVIVDGLGREPYSESKIVLDVGMSAASMRFLAGAVASSPILTVLTGSWRTQQRPMARIIEPLTAMGASILATDRSCAPLAIRGRHLTGRSVELSVASAEAKTAVLLAAVRAEGPTTVRTPLRCRDHTERMLSHLGASIYVSDDGCEVMINPDGEPLRPLEWRVPGEMSVAVYWLVVGSVHPDADLVLEDVCMNPTRTALLEALERMGATIDIVRTDDSGIEPVADLRVRSARLHGTTIEPEMVPRMTDELPGFLLAAALADGRTTITGAEDLRQKKSNRIETVAEQYRRLGARIEATPDGLVIDGVPQLSGGYVSSCGDHRLGNSLVAAALVSNGPVEVADHEVIAGTSYPHLWDDLRKVTA